VGNLHALRSLSVDCDYEQAARAPARTLPSRLGWLFDLTTLRLVCPHVRGLPEGLMYLGKLAHLQLQFSGALPKSFGELSSLETLVLDSPQVYALPESFGSLGLLRELSLVCPKLAALPESWGGLKALQKLWLSNCASLEALPGSFGSLPSLTHLEASCPQLKWLPASFGQLTSLLSLEVQRQQACGAARKLCGAPIPAQAPPPVPCHGSHAFWC